MCGLIALRSFTRADDPRDAARRALDAIARRGPDAEHLQYFAEPVPTVLGHRRLSILDLSTAADQPMTCPDTGNVVVFNGEIYNFIELRRELETLGHRFRTDSDTEVILHGWRAWGESLFERCNGMWAIVLLERASGELIYCRDRLGVKPLFLRSDGRRMILASEIRAIAAADGGYPAPNPGAIFDFLVLGQSEHGPDTFFDGIRAVAPGWVFRVAASGRTTSRPYHRWPEPGEAAPFEAAEVRELVRDATRLRLRSDAPTVCLLSGGLDSSILTRLSFDAADQPRTHFDGAFTYGYSEAAHATHDETAPAIEFMRGLGRSAQHHIHRAVAVPEAAELMDLVATQDEPFSTPSILASFRMYRAIRAAGYKVVLSGEGADELFGGYVRRYLTLAARDALRELRLPTLIKLLASGAVNSGILLNRLAWELPSAQLGYLLRRHRPSVGVMADALWDTQRTRLEKLRDQQRADTASCMNRDIVATNLPHVLRMADRNSMRFGLELRSPFLDCRLVTRALATPAAERLGDFHGKALLRRAFAEQLPTRTVWQRKSTGFGHAEQFLVDRMPVSELLDAMPAGVGDWLDLPRLRRELARGKVHNTLWLALSVALWYRSSYA